MRLYYGIPGPLLLLLLVAGCGRVVDEDGDGFSTAVDCDDADEAIFPGAPERCDGVDGDCDGQVDDAPADGEAYYLDLDGDGYGSPALSTRLCEAPAEGGYAADGTDCNDLDDSAHPGGAEACDGVDNDCDGAVDEDAGNVALYFYDADGDGYGASSLSTRRCGEGDGYVARSGDCDDDDPAISPETQWYPDMDGDGFGSPYLALVDCEQPDSHVLNPDDCGDDDALIFPGSVERCNGHDDDCDGVQTEEDEDADRDGQPSCAGDCDDDDRGIYLGALEICGDAVDDDCDRHLDNACPVFVSAADITLSGAVSGDEFGHSVATTDVSGDGADDLLVGAPQQDSGGTNAGAAYLFLGPLTAGSYDTTRATATFIGETGSDYMGMYSVGGDIDGDGFGDIIMNAYLQDTGGSNAGAVYVFFGPLTGEYDASAADVRIDGYSSTQYLGYYLLRLGDLDGDGPDDLVVGSYATSSNTGYIAIFSDLSEDATAEDADVFISGSISGAYVGQGGGALPGDVTGDGTPDVIYSEAQQNFIYLLEGPVSGAVGAADADVIFDASSGFNDDPGHLIEHGDINGDGYVDLILGAREYDTAETSAGMLAVFHGPFSVGTVDFYDPDAAIYGTTDSLFLGSYLDGSHVADVDTDGQDDLLVGVSAYNESYVQGGAAMLFYGPIAGSQTILDFDRGFLGDQEYDYVGQSSVRLADMDADGGLDAVFGGQGAGTAGEVYIFFRDQL